MAMGWERHERSERWRMHLRQWMASGMSRVAYCRWHGLSRSTLYRWERRLRDRPHRLGAATALESMAWIAVQVADWADPSAPMQPSTAAC